MGKGYVSKFYPSSSSSKQCEKGKKVHMGLIRFKHTTSACWARRTTVWMGLVLNGISREWPLGFHPVVDTAVFSVLLALRNISVYPQTQHFPFDCSLGFRMVGGDSSSLKLQHKHLPEGPGTSNLGRLGYSGPSLTQPPAHKWQATLVNFVKKKVSRQLCPMLIKWGDKI